MSKISIKSNDRVFITGKTGSGKTYLARFLTRKLTRLVVLDGKGSLNDWGCEDWSSDGKRKLQAGEPVRLRVRAPVDMNIKDLQSYWDEVLLAAYKAQNCTIYIDELYSVVPPNKDASPVLFGVYTRGRELGVGVWASTQRPVWIPLVAISESEHFFLFRLNMMDDKIRLSSFMGKSVLDNINDPYGFFYCKAIDDQSTYFRKLQAGGDPLIENVKLKPIEPETRTKILELFGG